MPSNVEIKAYLKNVEAVCKAAKELCTEGPTVLKQEDTFFNVEKGRLKLRKIEGATAQLIFYDRLDQKGPKFSDYNITQVSEPDSLKETLGKCLGIRGEVKKTRTLYIVGQTRVHIDKVHNLQNGDFMELEVVMKEGQTVEEGQSIADNLMKALKIPQTDLISGKEMLNKYDLMKDLPWLKTSTRSFSNTSQHVNGLPALDTKNSKRTKEPNLTSAKQKNSLPSSSKNDTRRGKNVKNVDHCVTKKHCPSVNMVQNKGKRSKPFKTITSNVSQPPKLHVHVYRSGLISWDAEESWDVPNKKAKFTGNKSNPCNKAKYSGNNSNKPNTRIRKRQFFNRNGQRQSNSTNKPNSRGNNLNNSSIGSGGKNKFQKNFQHNNTNNEENEPSGNAFKQSSIKFTQILDDLNKKTENKSQPCYENRKPVAKKRQRSNECESNTDFTSNTPNEYRQTRGSHLESNDYRSFNSANRNISKSYSRPNGRNSHYTCTTSSNYTQPDYENRPTSGGHRKSYSENRGSSNEYWRTNNNSRQMDSSYEHSEDYGHTDSCFFRQSCDKNRPPNSFSMHMSKDYDSNNSRREQYRQDSTDYWQTHYEAWKSDETNNNLHNNNTNYRHTSNQSYEASLTNTNYRENYNSHRDTRTYWQASEENGQYSSVFGLTDNDHNHVPYYNKRQIGQHENYEHDEMQWDNGLLHNRNFKLIKQMRHDSNNNQLPSNEQTSSRHYVDSNINIAQTNTGNNLGPVNNDFNYRQRLAKRLLDSAKGWQKSNSEGAKGTRNFDKTDQSNLNTQVTKRYEIRPLHARYGRVKQESDVQETETKDAQDTKDAVRFIKQEPLDEYEQVHTCTTVDRDYKPEVKQEATDMTDDAFNWPCIKIKQEPIENAQ